MGRNRLRSDLGVFLNSRRVGQLTRAASGAVEFQYDPSWLEWGSVFPISLSLPLRTERYIGAPVLAVFENLLPDTDAVRRQVAERVGAGGTDAFSLLSVVGRDCIGALQFLGEGDDPGPAGRVEGAEVSEAEIGALIGNLEAMPLGLDEDDTFRISLAGAQEKTALLKRDGRWFKPVGTTATTHILKPQIGVLPSGMDLSTSVENEFFCLKLLAAFGLPVANAEIAPFGAHRVLVVERFDRHWTKDDRLIRLPQEDCCQALSIPPAIKYQNNGGPGMIDILRLLQGSDEPARDQATFLKAQILFWMIGATDGHAKNFSLALTPGGRFSMTPLYDVISIAPCHAAGQIRRNAMKLAMAVGTKNHYRLDEIQPRHFVETAAKAGVGKAVVSRIFEEIEDMADEAMAHAVVQLEDCRDPGVTRSISEAIRTRLYDKSAAGLNV